MHVLFPPLSSNPFSWIYVSVSSFDNLRMTPYPV
jgi:hypothetical protein